MMQQQQEVSEAMLAKAIEATKPNKLTLSARAGLSLMKLLFFAFCMTRTFVPRDLSYFTLYVFTALAIEVGVWYITDFGGNKMAAAMAIILESAARRATSAEATEEHFIKLTENLEEAQEKLFEIINKTSIPIVSGAVPPLSFTKFNAIPCTKCGGDAFTFGHIGGERFDKCSKCGYESPSE